MRTITLYTAQEVAEIIEREPDAVFDALSETDLPDVMVDRNGFHFGWPGPVHISHYHNFDDREFTRRNK